MDKSECYNENNNMPRMLGGWAVIQSRAGEGAQISTHADPFEDCTSVVSESQTISELPTPRFEIAKHLVRMNNDMNDWIPKHWADTLYCTCENVNIETAKDVLDQMIHLEQFRLEMAKYDDNHPSREFIAQTLGFDIELWRNCYENGEPIKMWSDILEQMNRIRNAGFGGNRIRNKTVKEREYFNNQLRVWNFIIDNTRRRISRLFIVDMFGKQTVLAL